MKSLRKTNIAVNPSSKECNDFKPVVEQLRTRLDSSFYQQITEQSTINTLKYLFEHMRSGILVVIRENEVKLFISI